MECKKIILKDNLFDSENDEPALNNNNQIKIWFKEGFVHREEQKGPALIAFNKETYYKNGAVHRVNGPAFINGDEKLWYLNGNLITKCTGKKCKKLL